jgi:hypothetical protein
MRIIPWIKNNKLASILLVLLGLFILKNGFSSLFGVNSLSMSRSASYEYAGDSVQAPSAMKSISSIGGNFSSRNQVAPAPEVQNRMVVQNSYLSLVVKKVPEVLAQIKTLTSQIGGYMVNSNITNPEDNSSANITLRIPSEKLDETLGKFKGMAIKVASERLDGTDVTDQFVDNDARMTVLNSNLLRFKELMGKALEISDILRIQQEVFNLQSQIDNIKGQNKYMEQTSKMALVTIYLSTDEYTLPYAPSEPWRPEIIFKSAVRSLIGHLRGIAGALIWLIVYSIVWAPILFVIWYIKKRKK